MDTSLLEKLIQIQGVSGDEADIKSFLLDYIQTHQSGWKVQPKIIEGEFLQDAIILVFGQPKTALFAHTDTIGFTVGYHKNLIKVGGPRTEDGYKLVGQDSKGPIETELMVIEEDEQKKLQYVFDREIDRGTNLSFAPNFKTTKEYVQSPYLDNRLGCYVALEVAAQITDGIIVFSTYEEHGGGSVGFLGRYIYDQYQVRQALISDITWVTDGVQHGGGVAISMRDSGIPRRKYLNRILELAEASNIPYQREVESAGGSDGTMLQKTDLPFDWCFIGAPEDNVHSPNEKVHFVDIESMIQMHTYLMNHL